ncbi:MAG TPA: SRPBCC domain-containing protein [Trueperaceae bacterium]|nr:SRPBCC domain-containing protein [Trueperaceae bacterium]
MTIQGTTYKHTRTRVDDRTVRVERAFDAPRDLVWRTFAEPELLKQWWGRGNPLDLERFEFEKGGHWRVVEHYEGGSSGFEGRFREVTPKTRISQTFEWDGMPGYPVIDTTELLDDDGGRATRVVITSQFFSKEEAEGMEAAGAEAGMAQSHEALDALLQRLLSA